MKNFDSFKNAISVYLKFNDRYCLQYLEPIGHEKISIILSLIRKDKELTQEQYYTVCSMYSHFYSNYFKIKNLNSLEPRKIAQQFISRKKIRHFIFKRDGFKCLKCGSENKLQIDHILPIAKKGENKISNLQTLCIFCNSKKRDNYKDYRNGGK